MKTMQQGFTLIELMIVIAIIGKYVTSVDVATTTGKVIVTFGNQVNTRVSASILTFSAGASSTQGSITWNCKNTQGNGNKTNVANKYLPSACRT